uniref:Uncharacterized protein n=1 Tax=viral metagenome TaxID=1070528 RepID=A0A6M3JIU5_9ZZZZ
MDLRKMKEKNQLEGYLESTPTVVFKYDIKETCEKVASETRARMARKLKGK